MKTEKVGNYIRQKRKDKSLTQKELAKKLGVSDKAISKWERGICCPDISLLKELSSILGISVNELLSGEDIKKLEPEQSEDILLSSVKQYTLIEKRKTRRLLIITIIILIFYVGLVFAMYLTYNQVNKNDNLNWYTFSNKKVLDKYFTALENYDYETLKKMERSSYYRYGYNMYGDVPFEDETKCNEYKEQRKNGERVIEIGTICKLKYFEEIGLKFISHNYLNQVYMDGTGEWANNYDIVMEYDGIKIYFQVSAYVRNGIIAEMAGGFSPEQDDPFLYFKYPEINDKISSFLGGYSEWTE